MGASEPAKRFVVSVFASARAQFQQWVEQADRIGKRAECLDALRQTTERLELVPLDWGDTLFKYRTISAVECRGMIPGWWLVWYGVDETAKQVMVRSVLPAPGSPLAVEG
jgi:hypothetical protein